MFFSSLKNSKSQVKENVTQTPASTGTEKQTVTENLTESTVNELVPDLNNTSFNKLFHKQDSYPGPETSYENEAWAPEPYVGLFRKKRATAEEQLPSSSGSQ
ncbi:MAG: hypothetical protein ACYCVD_07165 [Desulfitobacteriaceae bacterium]